MGTETTSRRPLKVRDKAWAHSLAHIVAARRITPNTISLASVFFAGVAGACLFFWQRFDLIGRVAALVGAAAGIQLRLICNLIDGMVAVEGKMGTKSGEVFNDMPDRFADLMILVGAGYGLMFAWGRELGWLAGTFAVLTAYVRVLGGALGLKQSFAGPIAKQHRMAIMTFSSLASAVETVVFHTEYVLIAALSIIAIGSLYTTFSRAASVVEGLESK
jgi:phosphatidylglycerophosphate synthase